MKFRVFWNVLPCSQVDFDQRFRDVYCLHHQGALMMEAVRISEMLVSINLTTGQYIPEGSKLQFRNLFNGGGQSSNQAM
jgi:hypothetical protein